MDKKLIEKSVRDILVAIGENPDREGLADTPARVANMYEEIFDGMNRNPLDHVKLFTEERSDNMVVLKDIRFYSMCEHHLLPFFGFVNVAYIPRDKKILGLGKIARFAETLSKRPQMQERLTHQIGDAIMKGADARGALVMIKAEHLCMNMCGIKKPGANTITTEAFGVFKDDADLRAEALNLIK